MSPASTKLSYRDYLAFPEDGKRHELVDGGHLVTPSPNLYHQTLSRRIQFEIYERLERSGRAVVFDAPTDVHLSEHDVVVPDLVVVLSERRHILTPHRIQGPPDLIIEILSESTAAADRGAKEALYARSGVPEYWIVDPDAHVIEQRVLEGGRYVLVEKAEARISSRRIPELAIDLTAIW